MSLEIAEKLLQGEGLNHASYIRGLGLEVNPKNRNKTKDEYKKILESYSDVIERQGHDWFYKKKEEVEVREEVVESDNDELEILKLENARLKQEFAELQAKKKKEEDHPEELRIWMYHKSLAPEGKIFTESEVKNLDGEWKDHPGD